MELIENPPFPACPTCGFRVFNRRYPKCESCGIFLPSHLALSAAERAALLEQEELREKERQAR